MQAAKPVRSSSASLALWRKLVLLLLALLILLQIRVLALWADRPKGTAAASRPPPRALHPATQSPTTELPPTGLPPTELPPTALPEQQQPPPPWVLSGEPEKKGAGILLFAYGGKQRLHFMTEAKKAADSFRRLNPKIRIAVVSNTHPADVDNSTFDLLIRPRDDLLFAGSLTNGNWGDKLPRQWLTRLYYLAHSPFEVTWALDSNVICCTEGEAQAFLDRALATRLWGFDIAHANQRDGVMYPHNFNLLYRWSPAVSALMRDWILLQIERGVASDDQKTLHYAELRHARRDEGFSHLKSRLRVGQISTQCVAAAAPPPPPPCDAITRGRPPSQVRWRLLRRLARRHRGGLQGDPPGLTSGQGPRARAAHAQRERVHALQRARTAAAAAAAPVPRGQAPPCQGLDRDALHSLLARGVRGGAARAVSTSLHFSPLRTRWRSQTAAGTVSQALGGKPCPFHDVGPRLSSALHDKLVAEARRRNASAKAIKGRVAYLDRLREPANASLSAATAVAFERGPPIFDAWLEMFKDALGFEKYGAGPRTRRRSVIEGLMHDGPL